MIQSAQNNLIVKIDTLYIKNISDILRVAAIENNSNVDPTDLVNVLGEVISIPKEITVKKRGYDGFSTKDIKIGDIAIFRYDVIYSFIQRTPDAEKTYKHRMWYKGEELWSCDIQKVFGVIRDGEIHMVNGYVMLTDFIPNKIVLSQMHSNVREPQKSQIMHIGSPRTNANPIPAQMGDFVFYNPHLAAKYQIKGKPFRIIHQNQILGKEVM